MVADLDIHPTKNVVDWTKYAKDNVDSYPSYDVFTSVVYDDEFTFVTLDPDKTKAKVCNGDLSLCCLLDYSFDSTGDIFSLGVFSGLHTKDGSVRGGLYMEMCTMMKCDAGAQSQTCAQDQIGDHDFLSSSSTVFHKLRLSGTFSSSTKVFPEALFTGATLKPDQLEISPDGVMFLKRRAKDSSEDSSEESSKESSEESSEESSDPLLSFSLFGRRYESDSPQPDMFCPS